MITKIGLNLTAIRAYRKFGLIAFISPFLAMILMQSWVSYAVYPFLKNDGESYWYECPPICKNLDLTIDRWIGVGQLPLLLILIFGVVALVTGLKARSAWTVAAGGWAFLTCLLLWCSYAMVTEY